jgi:hypothetical protein
VKILEANNPGEAMSAARSACATHEVMNLSLTFVMDLPASESLPLSPFANDARRWQAPTKDDAQFFNHGEYMHAFGDPGDYLARELRLKPTSNRALVSLVNGAQIYASGDGILPSFMLVQAGFSHRSSDLLYLTAYYRALEVSAFLPINITELALIAEGLADAFGSFTRAEVTMHAFRAYSKSGSTALTRSEIDVLSPDEIASLVSNREFARIADLLREKSAPASIIEDSGLTSLSIEAAAAGWSPELLAELEKSIVTLLKLKQVREGATHGDWVAKMERTYAEHVLRAAELVMKE